MEFKAYIMDSAAVNRALARISHEIIERNGDSDEICLVGIMRRGAPLADILASKIESLGVKTQKGYLDITLYRDDLSESASQPTVNSGKLDFSVEGKTVVMVDDVLYTGRTARAAMDAISAALSASTLSHGFTDSSQRSSKSLSITTAGTLFPLATVQVVIATTLPETDA